MSYSPKICLFSAKTIDYICSILYKINADTEISFSLLPHFEQLRDFGLFISEHICLNWLKKKKKPLKSTHLHYSKKDANILQSFLNCPVKYGILWQVCFFGDLHVGQMGRDSGTVTRVLPLGGSGLLQGTQD